MLELFVEPDLVGRLQLQNERKNVLLLGQIDETGNVNVDKSGDQKLAIEPVHDAAMSRDHGAEVFDFEGSLEATGEEAAERSNNRTKERKRKRMQNERIIIERSWNSNQFQQRGQRW